MNTSSFARIAALVAAVGAGGAALAAGQGAAKPAAPAPKPAAPARAAAPTVTTPPLPDPGFQPPRPMPVMQDVYKFAANHPEVLKYVPCYCGCGAEGHPHNESCFVKRRDAKGNVAEWEMHGFGCTICVDVAREAMQMHGLGADVTSIRAAIEKKWAPYASGKTNTPMPPPRAPKPPAGGPGSAHQH